MSKIDNQKTYYTVAEVADLFGFSRQAVYNWIYAGQIPFMQMPTGAYRIAKEDVQKWRNKYKYQSKEK